MTAKLRTAGCLEGIPPSVPLSDVAFGLGLRNSLELEAQRNIAMTIYGSLKVSAEGGCLADMAPHLWDAEESDPQAEADRAEAIGQMQQLALLRSM